MHLRSVELFLEVAQQRSFSKGAAVHGVSQSSASQAVQTLEERLGVTLIDRSKRPLELTRAGEVFYEGCRDVVSRYRSVEDRVQQMQDRVVGVVRVAAIYSVGLLQMERYTSRFEQLYPDAEIDIEYLHPNDAYDRLNDDSADLGLVSYPRKRADFEVEEWQQQPMVLVVNRRHPLARMTEVRLADLEGQAFVAFTDELEISREIGRTLRKGKVHVETVAQFDNVEMIKKAVSVGQGVAILPRPTLREEIEAGTLVAIPLADVTLTRPMGIVHRRGRQLTTAARRFIDLLRQDPDSFPVEPELAASASPERAVMDLVGAMNGAGAPRDSVDGTESVVDSHSPVASPLVLNAGSPVGDEAVRRKRTAAAVGTAVGADQGT
jgi:DNA-binding transcriptional LysR family regulator